MISISSEENWLNARVRSDRSLPAVISEGDILSYGRLARITAGFADTLRREGVEPGSILPVLTGSHFRFLVSALSLWRIGGIPLPLNTMLSDPAKAWILKQTGSRFVLTDGSHAGSAEALNKRSIVFPDKFEEKIPFEETPDYNPDETAVIIFTSGSTGSPKGVRLTFANLFHSALSCDSVAGFSRGDRFLASLPHYHIGGFSIPIRSIIAGGTLIIPRSTNAGGIAESIIEYQPQFVSLVNTTLFRLAAMDIEPPAGLKGVFLGGGPADEELITAALKKNWPVIKVYGSTETASMVAAVKTPELYEYPGSAGKALGGVGIKILDANFDELPFGSVGQIAVKSGSVASGYLNNDKLTRSKFREDYFLTGDIGYLDRDGFLFVKGREDDIIISGGVKISPLEIETTIRNFKGVKDAAVLGLNDKEWGEKMIAAVVLEETTSKTGFEKEAAEKLKGFMKPKRFYYLNVIPRDELSKIRRDELMRLIFSDEE